MRVFDFTVKVAAHFLSSRKEAKQGYTACARLTKLAVKYSKKLEIACVDVLKHISVLSLRLISTLLKNNIIKLEEVKLEVRRNSNAYRIPRGAVCYIKRWKDCESK